MQYSSTTKEEIIHHGCSAEASDAAADAAADEVAASDAIDKAEEANTIRPDSITLVVLTGLPGLGKSYFIKQLTNLLAEPQHDALRKQVCVAHKDELTAEFKAANKRPWPKMADILDLTLQRLQQLDQDVVAPVLVFNMNMNPDWLVALINMLKEGYTIGQVVVLTPPAGLTYRQKQAAALVLASDVRTGNEESDVASTLTPQKAWEVIMGSFFGTPGKAVKSVGALSRAVGDDGIVFREVHYPVPQLSASVVINETAPTERPSDWHVQNLVYPQQSAILAALETLLGILDLGCLV